MIIEVQLHHASTGWFIISEPDGWKDAKLGFERHEDAFHCLVEFFRSAFRGYGSNGIEDGGRDKIKAIERDFGPAALIQVLVRIKETEFDEFEDFYHGQIPIVSLQEVIDEDHTIGFTIEQNDTWSKFISRLDMPINIQSPLSQDGVSVTVINPIEIPLTPQPIRAILHNEQKNGFNTGTIYPDSFSSPDFQADITSGGFAQLNLDDEILDELKNNYKIPFAPVSNEVDIASFMSPELPSELEFDLKFTMTVFRVNFVPGFNNDDDKIYADLGASDFTYQAKVWLKIGDDTPIELTRFDFAYVVPDTDSQINSWSTFTYTGTTALLDAGTSIRIYVENTGSAPFGYRYNTIEVLVQQLIILGDESNDFEMQPIIETYFPGPTIEGPTKTLIKAFGVPPGEGVESYIKITGKTIFPQTTTTGFLVHDIGRSILDRICDQDNTLVSNFFGNPSTTPTYAETGCGSNNGGFRGLQLRGWSLADKQFSMSFKDWWEGLNPRYNLSLRPVRDSITGKVTIHIEQKKKVYRTDTSSITISNVRKIGKDYDMDNIFNVHKIGYRQWESEDLSGLDDPQTVQDRANNLRNIGKKWEMLSSWMAASYAIETTRQARKEKNSDHRFDNETFLIALTPSGGGFVPERDENFSLVTGVRYPEDRYNLRHTPARMFIAWLDYLSGMSQVDSGNGFTFQGGEGNYDMNSDLENTDCEDYSEAVLEKQDLAVSSTFLFIPRLFTFDTALTLSEYKAIRENSDVCIMVSQTAANHVTMLIKDLEFTPYTGQATIKAWAKQWIDLQVPTDDVTIPENMGRIFDDTFDLTFE